MKDDELRKWAAQVIGERRAPAYLDALALATLINSGCNDRTKLVGAFNKLLISYDNFVNNPNEEAEL